MWNEELIFQLSEKSHNRKRNYFKDNTAEYNNENISKGKLKEMKKYLTEKTERSMKCKFYKNIEIKWYTINRNISFRWRDILLEQKAIIIFYAKRLGFFFLKVLRLPLFFHILKSGTVLIFCH